MTDRLPPFQSLDERLAGKPYEEVLIAGVTPAMDRPLREWISVALFLREDLAKRVMLRLGLVGPSQLSYKEILAEYTYSEMLLCVVDAILQLHPNWNSPDFRRTKPTSRVVGGQRIGKSLNDMLQELESILMDSGSELRIDVMTHRLLRRIDETVVKAVSSVVEKAPEKASDHLRSAWAAVYGMWPDPDTAYREAVRAVEDVACPLVLKKQAAAGKATLGTVIGELKNNPSGWLLEFADSSGISQNGSQIVPLLELLWHGQVSRHAGGAKNRRQTQSEAEAAVHLAATLVQWLSAAALRRRS